MSDLTRESSNSRPPAPLPLPAPRHLPCPASVRAGRRSLQCGVRQLDEAIARCRVDESLERTVVGDFSFPLGAYPVEPLIPAAGYTLSFEPSDGEDGPGHASGGLGGPSGAAGADRDEPRRKAGGAGRGGASGLGRGENDPESAWSDSDDEEPGEGRFDDSVFEDTAFDDSASGELEEWPDRYVFDILVPNNRVEPLCRALFALFPGRIYPILDVLGHDEYREVDPYVSYELLGLDRFTDAIRRFRPFFFEDGLVGFGAMSEEPFLYMFVDEHKIVTVRAEVPLRERVERVLAAFDLKQVEELQGADSVTHEHRGVLDASEQRLDLLIADEIIEELQEQWRLELNINPDTNLDEDGQSLGITGWRCFVRVDVASMWDEEPESVTNDPLEQGVIESGMDLAEGEREVMSRSGVSGEEREGGKMVKGQPGHTDNMTPTSRYAEVLLTVDALSTAQELAVQAVMELLETESQPKETAKLEDDYAFTVVVNDRLRPESFAEAVRAATGKSPRLTKMRAWAAAWVG